MISKTFVFAGGGTGGHLFPGLAIAERLRAQDHAARCFFICSDKPLDAEILQREHAEFAPIPARPFGVRPKALMRFARSWGASVRAARGLLRAQSATHVLAMGGYVAAPIVQAARAEKIPVTLVNLDAVPGKANRWIARHAATRLTAARIADHAAHARNWQLIPPIVRAGAIAPGPATAARERLGLATDRPTLFVTGGSQGAGSINRLLVAFAERHTSVLKGWQILHQTGRGEEAAVQEAYARLGIASKVVPFLTGMADAWATAEIAVARCGANTVGEVWANGVPTLFLPYPYHRDQHQRWNAESLVEAGGAILVNDAIDPEKTLPEFEPAMLRLLSDPGARETMRGKLRELGPADGADRVARHVMAG